MGLLLGKWALKKCSCEELPGGRLSGVLLASGAEGTDTEPALLAQLASDLFLDGLDICAGFGFKYVEKWAAQTVPRFIALK